MATVGAHELQERLEAWLDRVSKGEDVMVTRGGEPVAVLVHPSRLRRRDDADVRPAEGERIERRDDAVTRNAERGSDPVRDDAEAMLDELREDWESRH